MVEQRRSHRQPPASHYLGGHWSGARRLAATIPLMPRAEMLCHNLSTQADFYLRPRFVDGFNAADRGGGNPHHFATRCDKLPAARAWTEMSISVPKRVACGRLPAASARPGSRTDDQWLCRDMRC